MTAASDPTGPRAPSPSPVAAPTAEEDGSVATDGSPAADGEGAEAAPPRSRGWSSARPSVRTDPQARDGSRPGPGEPRTQEATRRPSSGTNRTRRATLVLRRIDPWSVAKMTLVLSAALLVVAVVAVLVLYLVLDLVGVFGAVNDTLATLTGNEDGGGLQVVVNAGQVLGVTAVLGALYVLLATALATLGALLYNACADLAGGIEVTLAES